MATQTIPPAAEPLDTSRFEQVNGKLIERPSPSLTHGKLQRKITALLDAAVNSRDMHAIQEVSLNRVDEPKSDWLTPDSIVSDAGGFREAQNGHVLPPVLLAVEILSEGQSFFGMRRKVSDYISWGVKHIWLVDPYSSSIATFRASNYGRAALVYEGSVEIADTQISIPLSAIFS
jgi:Uma2 family endonuclease